MILALIKERKSPPDKRVVLSPNACQDVMKRYPETRILVERSDIRTFPDDQYEAAGCTLLDQALEAEILLGVKEVPVDALIPGKKYFFFSHTIKKQPYNRKLLQAVLDKHIELYDHETLTDEKGVRLVAFGYYAGVVGAYNGIRTYGLKTGAFRIPKASELPNKEALISTLRGLALPPVKIVLTGKGRVGSGAREMLVEMGIAEVSVQDYLNTSYDHPVFCQLDVMDYNRKISGEQGTNTHFYKNPGEYESDFFRFAQVSELFIAGHFYGNGAPYIFTREMAAHPENRIKVVADISCDIGGPVACTLRASTIADPVYGYDPHTGAETDFHQESAIAVMAVDNLPCELPADASEGFGEKFVNEVLPAFFNGDANGILERARMTRCGKLTPRYAYLQDWVDGRE